MHLQHTFRSIVLAGLVGVAALATPCHAQAGGGGGGGLGGFGGFGGMTPEQQQAMMDNIQQMQSIGQQVMQNMQNAGVDPQTFFQDIGQQMQNGNLDMDALQKQMIDKGFMTQQMSDQLTNSMTQMQTQLQVVTTNSSLNNIKQQLNASDEEWTVLLPKIQRVLGLLRDVALPTTQNNTRGGGGLGGGGGIGGVALAQPNAPSEVAKAFSDLQTVLKDPNAAEDRIADKLRVWRALHDKARAELVIAQNDLISILTLRQEGILMGLGML